ncbi:10 kDa chaperonin 1, chloroplastic-like isoform X2 [Camellia sinensis]|uniref:10 kDa chaperonin 1, chloroplastic-like isoform X2 n=1 Tax=Camellia sinensis TaxID=4442 RepID=UPI001035DA13|nr:10 kDa chaperonin 1, chloroplastic-like isoform X2 [Camellia sinensis]
MASTFITVSKAFTSHNNNNNPSSLSNQRLLGGCRNSVRVCAIAKEIEPTKVVPQADRVLIRLEKLPEKTALGVLLPKSAVQFERHLMGEILAVGAEVEQVEAGKKVLFSDINAYEGMRPVVHIHLTGDNYTLLMSC